MALFLVIGLIVMDLLGLRNSARGETDISGDLVALVGFSAVAAGPEGETAAGEDVPAALASQLVLQDAVSRGDVPASGDAAVLESGVLEGGLTSAGLAAGQGGIISYVIKKGDTLSEIAAQFGISVQTIVSSNPDLKTRSLQVGQALQILPVSGALYSVRDGETAESIAASFGLTANQLQQFNPNVRFANISAGMTLVIPGASPKNGAIAENGAPLPDLGNYFAMPATGFNWGVLHPHNAVDIANSCGTQIVAAAEGLIADVSVDDWSDGYGHYVEIEHPNGTKTKYAHMEKVSVSLGDYVKQGDPLGTMGRTGDATGCHVHFEVDMAKNPFAK